MEREKEKPVPFRAADKSSCRSRRRAVCGLLVGADETRAIKILEARVSVSGVIGSVL